MNSGRKIGLMAVAALLMLTSCSNYDEEIVTGNTPVRVELAYTFSPSAAGNQTRQSSEVVVPNTSAPRLPDNLMIVPMIGESPQKTETTWNEPVKKVNSSRYTSLYYYSQYCDFEQGVDGCLVYGSADDVTPPTGVDSEVYNGNLIPSVNLSTVTDQSTSGLNNLTFDLEAIKNDISVPDAASTLAGYLTDVANLHAGGQYWKNSDNVILKNLFDNFTNYGRNLPGSAASVKALLTALNTVASSYRNESGTIGETEGAILDAIITNTAADKVTAAIGDVTASYPRNINLPDGAAALRWVEVEEEGGAKVKKFMPQMQTTTLDNINTITRFAYPASLYYFVDSSIQTSEGMVSLPTEYNNITVEDTKTAWAGILENFTAGGEVTATTRAVALTDPVQYAVAQLQVNTSYSTPFGKPANTLPDAVNANIPVDNNFALKGVIICGQRPVNYEFVPGDNSDAYTKFIYDSQVKENCTLSATSTDACTTLVLQSYGGEDVNIILEYENNSELTFKCVDGIVYPHTRFYLIGKVEALKGDDVNTDEKTHQVFTKDYITTVNMTVTSLAKAYNVLPNLLGGGLELGVELTTKWIQAETTNVLLNESD